MLQRHRDILALVRARGYAAIDELARASGVTPQTIRRDINTLAAEGVLRRHHGGASVASSSVNRDYAARRHEQQAEKRRIARAVAALVPDGATLFLAIGTTVEAIAAELARREGLKVVTNSTAAAALLQRAKGIEVFVTGGVLRPNNGGLVGVAAVRAVEQFRCDLAIMSCGGIEADGTLLDFDHAEVMVMQAMMAQARAALVAIDRTKFLRPAAVRLADLAQVRTLVVDAPPPPVLARAAAAAGARVVVAG